MAFVAGYPGALELAMKVAPRMFASRVRSSSCPTNRGVFFEPARGSDEGCQPAFRVGPTVGPLSVSDRSKCYLVLLKMPRKLLTLRSLQTCQGSGVGSIPIGRSIKSSTYKLSLLSSGTQGNRSCSARTASRTAARSIISCVKAPPIGDRYPNVAAIVPKTLNPIPPWRDCLPISRKTVLVNKGFNNYHQQ